MRRRTAVTCLAVLAAMLTSFDVLPLPDAPATPPQLPDVSAPPQAATPAPVTEADRIEAYLLRRHTGLSQREIRELSQVILEEADRHDLDVDLILAVMHVESRGYHRAVSPVGAMGLMQLMPSTGEAMARELGVEWHGPSTLFDPIVNVRLGIAYLRELSERYDHVPTALAAYNWGPARIDRRLRRGARLPELYVKQVQRAQDSLDDDLRRSSSS